MKILKSLLSDIATLGLSFFLALIVWVVAVRASDPPITKSLELDITEIGFLSSEGSVTKSEDVVRITIEGPQSIVNPLTSSDFSAAIDLSEIPFGETEAPIDITYDLEDVEIVFQDPQTLIVTAEQIIRKPVPVTIETRGSASRGHTVGEIISDPAEIIVTGPASRVEGLREARITVFLEQPREDVIALRRPTYVNEELNVVSIAGLSTSHEEVEVIVSINEIAGVAEKPITVDWTGSPALGYRLLNVSVEPNSLLINGSPTALDEVRSISTEEIDISGLNTSFTQQVSLIFPSGVTSEEVEPVFVTIEIEPIFTTDVVRSVPEIRALGEGYTATVSPGEMSIFLFGPLPALESINAGDVTVTLDLLELEPGEYNIKPIVSVSVNEVEIRSTQPETVTVIIEEIDPSEVDDDNASGEVTATPTPTRPPTRTPTPTPTP